MAMEDIEAATNGSRKRRGGLLWFLFGAVVGVVGTLYLPGLAGRYVPGLGGTREAVSGRVVAESRESTDQGDRLLLTVDTPAGAVLATFTERVAEIDLLVDEQDSVSLALGRYEPFVRDPEVSAVRKGRMPAGAAAGADAAAAEDGETRRSMEAGAERAAGPGTSEAEASAAEGDAGGRAAPAGDGDGDGGGDPPSRVAPDTAP